MQLLIDPCGEVRCVYSEVIDLATLGPLIIRRGSHVEPDDQGRWWADLSPVGGQRIGPFDWRSNALEAELVWLETNWLNLASRLNDQKNGNSMRETSMSTRSTIARRNPDGSYDASYCHWDGYPSHHAPLLLEHYRTSRKIQALLDLGDLSVLAETIGKKHSFDSHSKKHAKWCRAYGRDRGEKDCAARHFLDEAGFQAMLADCWTEWVYVYDVAAEQWCFTNNPSPTWFKCCGHEQLPLRPLVEWKDSAA